MYSNPEHALNWSDFDLTDFIETRPESHSIQKIIQGVDILRAQLVLDKACLLLNAQNPEKPTIEELSDCKVVNVLLKHEFIPGSFLLYNLHQILNIYNRIDEHASPADIQAKSVKNPEGVNISLDVLLEPYAEQIYKNCVYCQQDHDRFLQTMPIFGKAIPAFSNVVEEPSKFLF